MSLKTDSLDDIKTLLKCLMLKKKRNMLAFLFFFVFLHQLKLNKRNMRKLSCVAFVGLFVLSLLSCSQDDAKECVSENAEFSSCTEEYCQAKKRIKSFLSDMQEAVDEVKMVVEGVNSAKAAKTLAEKYEIDMPIVQEVNKVLFEGKTAKEALADLMLRDKKIEHPELPWK